MGVSHKHDECSESSGMWVPWQINSLGVFLFDIVLFFTGTFVKEACTKVFERSVCHQCEFDTYTEHDNGISSCLKCTKCRPGTQRKAIQSQTFQVFVLLCEKTYKRETLYLSGKTFIIEIGLQEVNG